MREGIKEMDWSMSAIGGCFWQEKLHKIILESWEGCEFSHLRMKMKRKELTYKLDNDIIITITLRSKK